jgi:hypothetical protein
MHLQAFEVDSRNRIPGRGDEKVIKSFYIYLLVRVRELWAVSSGSDQKSWA